MDRSVAREGESKLKMKSGRPKKLGREEGGVSRREKKLTERVLSAEFWKGNQSP